MAEAPLRTGVVHVHSDYSHDGRDSLADLRDFGRARDLAFIGLTDHAEDLDREAFDRLVAECRRLSDDRLTLLPGLEFRFAGYKGVHLLALGLQRWIEPATFDDFFAASDGAVGLTIAAHPSLYGWALPAPVAARIVAIEVWNAAYDTRYLPDPRAMRLLDRIRMTRPEVVGVAGLDQHDSRNDRGTRITLTSAGADPLAEIRAGRFVNRGRTMSFDSRARMPAPARLLLGAARWGLDRVNQVHERIAKLRAAPAP